MLDLEKTTKKPLGETLRTMSCVEQEINKEFESELQAAIVSVRHKQFKI